MNKENLKDQKLGKALKLLTASLKSYKESEKDPILFAAVSKAFEVSFEYAWKSIKRRCDTAGLEVYSPRDAIKAGAQLGLLTDLVLWDSFLNARNLSVHDYVGISDADFIVVIEKFEKEMKRTVLK